MRKRIGLLLAAIGTAAGINAAPLELVCHYMQWFQCRQVDGQTRYGHWNWSHKSIVHDPERKVNPQMRDIYSVLYPKIGLYDSEDPAVIDYHILTAKAAGINAFIVDWYNPDLSLGKLLEQANRNGFKVGVCYEEKTCFPDWNAKAKERKDAYQKALDDFRYLKTQFSHPAYWRRNGRPVLMVFGNPGDNGPGWSATDKWRFTPEEWRQLLKDSGNDNVDLVLADTRDSKAGFPTFGWCGPDNPAYPDWFYDTAKKLVDQQTIPFFIGTVTPGFDDRGTQGWGSSPRIEYHLGVETLERYTNKADQTDCDTVQIVTWNDFAEGTCIEPTFEYGNLFLEYIGAWHARRNQLPWQPGQTRIAFDYYCLTRKLGETATDEMKQALLQRDYPRAAELGKALADQSGYQIPRAIGIQNEFPVYQPNHNRK